MGSLIERVRRFYNFKNIRDIVCAEIHSGARDFSNIANIHTCFTRSFQELNSTFVLVIQQNGRSLTLMSASSLYNVKLKHHTSPLLFLVHCVVLHTYPVEGRKQQFCLTSQSSCKLVRTCETNFIKQFRKFTQTKIFERYERACGTS